MFAQGIYYKFGRNVLNISLVKKLPLFILGVIVLIVLAVFSGNKVGNFPLYGTLVLIIYTAILLAHTLYRYESYKFMLDEFSLHIRSGIFNRKETSIPYRQIQDVTMEESYIERMFRVVELSVFTAGHESIPADKNESSGAFFPLIDRVYAVALQQELLKHSNVQEFIHHGQDEISHITDGNSHHE